MDAICLVTKPFSLVTLIVFAAVRSVSLATLAWWNLVTGIVKFHVDLCRKVLFWIVASVSLPARILTALDRQRTLEMHVHELQTRWENVIWENRELEQRLQRAIKERKVIETVFEEVEVEHEKALNRIDQLENELQDLKEKNLRLKEIQGKSQWDYKACDGKMSNVHEGIPLSRDYVVPSWSTGYKSGGEILQDILMRADSFADTEKVKSQEQSPYKSSLNPYQYATKKLSSDMLTDETLERQRIVALSRSLFSSILSLIVGMIIWEAEDPCMPLVAALFIVVGMSLNSVVQFFATIKNKPASDAVALLSINWFILGTLTSPALPGVVRILAPHVIRLADRLIIWLGSSS